MGKFIEIVFWGIVLMDLLAAIVMSVNVINHSTTWVFSPYYPLASALALSYCILLAKRTEK